MALLGSGTKVTGPFAEGLLLETFHGSDILATPYTYDLNLLSQDPSIQATNADNMPPYALPEKKTQSGIKSRWGNERFHNEATGDPGCRTFLRQRTLDKNAMQNSWKFPR